MYTELPASGRLCYTVLRTSSTTQYCKGGRTWKPRARDCDECHIAVDPGALLDGEYVEDADGGVAQEDAHVQGDGAEHAVDVCPRDHGEKWEGSWESWVGFSTAFY